MTYTINRDFTVSGYIQSESLREKEQNPERMSGVYFVTLHADDPFLRQELTQLCEMECHPHQKLHVEDQPADTNLIRFESINNPRLLPFEDGSYLGINDRVSVDVRVEVNTSADGQHVFSRFMLRRVSPYVDPMDGYDWDSVNNEYNF
nr:hypothetical protein 13 [bacterium]